MGKRDELILRLLSQILKMEMDNYCKSHWVEFANETLKNTEINKANDLVLEVDKYFEQLRGIKKIGG